MPFASRRPCRRSPPRVPAPPASLAGVHNCTLQLSFAQTVVPTSEHRFNGPRARSPGPARRSGGRMPRAFGTLLRRRSRISLLRARWTCWSRRPSGSTVRGSSARSVTGSVLPTNDALVLRLGYFEDRKGYVLRNQDGINTCTHSGNSGALRWPFQ